MAGLELTPSKPPKAFDISTREALFEALQALIDDYGCQGSVTYGQDGLGGYRYVISVNREGQAPAAEAIMGSPVMLVADVSGVWALTQEEIAQRYP